MLDVMSRFRFITINNTSNNPKPNMTYKKYRGLTNHLSTKNTNIVEEIVPFFYLLKTKNY